MFMFKYTNGLLTRLIWKYLDQVSKLWQIIKLLSWFIKFQFLAKMFFLHTNKIRNKLPLELKRSTSITIFKKYNYENSVWQNTLSSAIDLTVSLVNNDINLLINVYILTSLYIFVKIISVPLSKWLSMIKTVFPNVKYSRPCTQAYYLRLLIFFVINKK